MITTITIEASSECQLIERIDQIKNAIENNTIEDCMLMDGSFQVGGSNVEVNLP